MRPNLLALLLAAAILLATACAPAAPPATAPEPVPGPPDSAAVRLPEPLPAPSPLPPDTISVAPARLPRASIRLAFTGDINLGTTTIPDGVPADSGHRLLAAARQHLVGDLVIGNFEGVLADTGTSEKCGTAKQARRARNRPPARLPARPPARCYAFRTPTHLASRLLDAGFTHLNLANNHANDYGPAGRASTEATLTKLGLTVYGPLDQIAIDSVRRNDSLTVVGLVGFTTYPHSYNLLDIDRSAAVVDSVRELVDVLVVTFHGGTEGGDAVHTGEGPEFLGSEPRGDLRRWAHAVIDAGADAVVGHGPHVLRGIEFYRDKPIVYSLGNFATFSGFSLKGPLAVTGVLQLELTGDGALARARLVPMRQLPREGPHPDPGGAAIELLRQLSGEDFGPSGAKITGDGRILPP